MMFERSEREFSLLRRGATLALALLLLIAQASATAHFHQRDFRDNLTQSVQGGDALCSLCLFHFHASANPGTPPVKVAALVAVGRAVHLERVRLHAPAIALLFSRAPPLAL
jgi:hypothetical protein